MNKPETYNKAVGTIKTAILQGQFEVAIAKELDSPPRKSNACLYMSTEIKTGGQLLSVGVSTKMNSVDAAGEMKNPTD